MTRKTIKFPPPNFLTLLNVEECVNTLYITNNPAHNNYLN